MNYTLLVEDFKRAEADRLAALREGRKEENKLVAEMTAEIDAGRMKPGQFDFGGLFAGAFGLHDYYACKSRQSSPQEVFARLSEAEGGVTTAAFQNISGQIVYSAARTGYENEEFVFAKLIPEDKAVILTGEKIPGITDMGNSAAVRKENDPYVEVGFGEDWIYTPPIKDIGGIVSLTWEAVFNDRTGDVLAKAKDIGYSVGLNEEISAIDCIIDENTTEHRYNWRSAGPIATYGDNSGTHSWDNLSASNALVDWTNLNTVEVLAAALVNPFTGLPIMTMFTDFIVTPQLIETANRIMNATEIRVTTPGYATSGNPTQTNVKNPYMNRYTVRTSRLLAYRLGTDTSWFLANINKLALRKVAEPLRSTQMPSNSKEEFERRIVARFQANKMFAHVVREPRAAAKSTA